MPTTVPNRPMKGAAEPMVARKPSRPSSRSISRVSARSIALSMRVCRPSGDLAPFSKLFFHSRMAATKIEPMPVVLRSASVLVELLERLAGPERPARSGLSALRHAGVGDKLVDDDRPGPDRGAEQADHHQLDDPSGLREQVPYGQLNAGIGERKVFHRRSLKIPGVARGWPLAHVNPVGPFASMLPETPPRCADRGLFGTNVGERKARWIPVNPHSTSSWTVMVKDGVEDIRPQSAAESLRWRHEGGDPLGRKTLGPSTLADDRGFDLRLRSAPRRRGGSPAP